MFGQPGGAFRGPADLTRILAGLGQIGGFKAYIEDRADLGYDALYKNIQGLMGKGMQTPQLGGLFSMFTVNVPQLDADIDRVKAKAQGVCCSPRLSHKTPLQCGSGRGNACRLAGWRRGFGRKDHLGFRVAGDGSRRTATGGGGATTTSSAPCAQTRSPIAPSIAR